MKSQKKILLAEDDPDDREIFFEFLEDKSDFVILSVVENGEQVVAFLEEQTATKNFPDIILLDQNMPKKNGIQTLAFLKNQPLFSSIPVFMYSTYVNESLVKACNETGALKLYIKPTDMEGYHELIDDMLTYVQKRIDPSL